MASPTGSVKSAITEKTSSKDKNNDKTDVDVQHTFSQNSDHVKPLSSKFPAINLVVDLPIYGPIDDQAPMGEQEKVLKDKAEKEATQGREAVDAKSQKEAQVQENIQVMPKRLRAMFGDGPRSYKPRKRLCDVFGDVPDNVPDEESRVVSSDEGFISSDECTSHPPKDQP